MKIYNNSSIIETPDEKCDIPVTCYVDDMTDRRNQSGTFIGCYAGNTEFIVYEDHYKYYCIRKHEVTNEYGIFTTDENCYDEYGRMIWVYVTGINECIAKLMDINELSHEEIMSNMNILRDYMKKFVDVIDEFADNYQYHIPKSAK